MKRVLCVRRYSHELYPGSLGVPYWIAKQRAMSSEIDIYRGEHQDALTKGEELEPLFTLESTAMFTFSFKTSLYGIQLKFSHPLNTKKGLKMVGTHVESGKEMIKVKPDLNTGGLHGTIEIDESLYAELDAKQQVQMEQVLLLCGLTLMDTRFIERYGSNTHASNRQMHSMGSYGSAQ
jgi:hypothetical protein